MREVERIARSKLNTSTNIAAGDSGVIKVTRKASRDEVEIDVVPDVLLNSAEPSCELHMEDESITSNRRYVARMIYDTPEISPGCYVVMWHADVGNRQDGAKVRVKCVIDKVKASKCTYKGTGPREYQPFSGWKHIKIKEKSNHTVKLVFKCVNGEGKAIIRNCRILIKKV